MSDTRSGARREPSRASKLRRNILRSHCFPVGLPGGAVGLLVFQCFGSPLPFPSLATLPLWLGFDKKATLPLPFSLALFPLPGLCLSALTRSSKSSKSIGPFRDAVIGTEMVESKLRADIALSNFCPCQPTMQRCLLRSPTADPGIGVMSLLHFPCSFEFAGSIGITEMSFRLRETPFFFAPSPL